MTITPKILALALLAALLILVGFTAISSRLPSQTQQQLNNKTTEQSFSYETKQNEGGNVTVSVTPLRLKDGFPASFDVAFETHSVDLTFDVEQIATLADETGTTYTPVWDGSPPGGHHRSGTLRFTPDLTDPATVMLTFSDIAGVPSRTFTWVYPEESSTKGGYE